MRALYTLAYPNIAPDNRLFIEAFRREHDLAHRDVVDVHFTLVFGNRDIQESDYIAHVQDIAATWEPISFVCRYAMLDADDTNDQAHVFLVPDEGYSGISLLHDQLYTGLLAPALRLDRPFTPHMTIGRLSDRATAQTLCDRLNSKGVSIDGSLDRLTICALENGRILDLATAPLSR